VEKKEQARPKLDNKVATIANLPPINRPTGNIIFPLQLLKSLLIMSMMLSIGLLIISFREGILLMIRELI
jgi:hypothetical protein